MKSTHFFYRFCNSIPVWTATFVILAVIAVLTLMPSSDVPSVRIPHIDKLVHFLMFGGLSSVILMDYSRFRRHLGWSQWIVVASLSAAIGGLIELLQDSMEMGRGAEWNDFIADTLGAFLLPLCFFPFLRGVVSDYSLSLRDIHDSSAVPERIVELYVSSFPPDERRPVDSIRKLIDDHGPFHFSLIRSGRKTVGFITWWILEKGVYVEHFAMSPELRSRGLGRLSMERFCTLNKAHGVILEVEMPGSNEMADRRIKFYERCGFRSHPAIEYIQPPYTPSSQPVELMLMTFGPIDDVEGLAEEIKRRVYGAS